jgi:hypothetical protein
MDDLMQMTFWKKKQYSFTSSKNMDEQHKQMPNNNNKHVYGIKHHNIQFLVD